MMHLLETRNIEDESVLRAYPSPTPHCSNEKTSSAIIVRSRAPNFLKAGAGLN
jgi:hypothetical protein